MTVISIASPVLKCVLPDAPPIDERFQQDVFGSKHTFADQPRLAARAFDDARAHRARRSSGCFPTGAPSIPTACFDRIVEALRALADEAAAPRDRHRPRERARLQCRRPVRRRARLLAAIDHPALQRDLGSRQRARRRRDAVPDGYRAAASPHRPRAREGLPRQRPHADVGSARRDECRLARPTARARPRRLPRRRQPRDALDRPGGDKLEASTICGRNLTALVREVF